MLLHTEDSEEEVDNPDEIWNDSDLCEDSSNDDLNDFRRKLLHSSCSEEEENNTQKKEEINIETLQPKLQEINKQVGSFVIISYEGKFYPGVIEQFDEEGATVSAMKRTLKDNWKWPEQKDELDYRWDDIVGGINPLKCLIRGIFFLCQN